MEQYIDRTAVKMNSEPIRASRAILYFDAKNHTKKYEYDFPYVPGQSLEDKAYAISDAMVMSQKKSKPGSRLNPSQYYKLILGYLSKSTDYHLPGNDLSRCFDTANLYQSNETKTNSHWRVGVTGWSCLGIDIDDHDQVNLESVKKFYSGILDTTFTVFKTGGGFWLLSNKKYSDKNEWLYDNCRLFNPHLTRDEYYKYKESILNLDTKDHKTTTQEFKQSKYYNGHGIFDIAFTYINIKRGQMTLRISKKRPGDKIEEIIT